MSDMTDDIGYLSQEIGPRPAGTEEEQKASEYIAKRLRSTTGLKTEIEEFSCNSQPGVVEAICFGLSVLFTIIGMLAPQVSVLAFAITSVCCALYLCEVFDKPVLSRLFTRGISQNVITRYKPVSKGGVRPRKVIIVANYDSDKVRAELSPGLMGAYPLLVKASTAAIVALPVLWLIRAAAAVTTGTAALIFNVIFIILSLVTVLPVVVFAMHRSATFNEGANSNASGVAAMMEIARRVADAQTIKEPDLEGEEPVIHGEEEAYETGAVPEGVPVSYEVEANVPADAEGSYEPSLGEVVPREVSKQREDVDVSRETGREDTAVEPVRLAQAKPAAAGQPTPEQVAAQRAETINVFTGEAPLGSRVVPQQEQDLFERNEPVETQQAAPAVPDWYKAAQERAKAKKGNMRPVHPVRRSRYADALDAAVRESHAHFEEANKAVQREAQQYRETFQQGIREIAAPEHAEHLPPAQPREPKPIVRPVETPVAPVRETEPVAQSVATETTPQAVASIQAPENRFERATQQQTPAASAYANPATPAAPATQSPAPAPTPVVVPQESAASMPASTARSQQAVAPENDAARVEQQPAFTSQPHTSVPEEPVVETFIEDVSRETVDQQGLPQLKPYVETFDEAGIEELESAEAAQVIERPARQESASAAQPAPAPSAPAVGAQPSRSEQASPAPVPQATAPTPEQTAPVAPVVTEESPRNAVATAVINDGRVMVDGPHDMDQFVQTSDEEQLQAATDEYQDTDVVFNDYYQDEEPEESRFRETTQRWKKRASGAFSSLRTRVKNLRDERKQLPEAYPDYEEDFTTAQIGEVTERAVDCSNEQDQASQATTPINTVMVDDARSQVAAEPERVNRVQSQEPRTTNRVDVTVPRERPQQSPAAHRAQQERNLESLASLPADNGNAAVQTPSAPTAEKKQTAAERVIVTATEADQPQRQSRESTISMPPIDVCQLREQVQTGTLNVSNDDEGSLDDRSAYGYEQTDGQGTAYENESAAAYDDSEYAGYDDATYGDYDYYEDEPTRFDDLKHRAGGLFHRMRDSFDSARDKISDRVSAREGAHQADSEEVAYVDGAYSESMGVPEVDGAYAHEETYYGDEQESVAYAEGYAVTQDDVIDETHTAEEPSQTIDEEPLAVENDYGEAATPASPVAPAHNDVSVPAVEPVPEEEHEAPAPRAERPKPTYRSNPNRARIDVPSVITVPDPADDASALNKQPAPLAAETARDGQTAAKTLLRQRIPRVALDGTGPMSNDKIEMDNKKAALRNTLPSMSGSITAAPAVDPYENNQRVSLSGSFSAVGNTGSFKPVGDELVEGMSPDEMYIDDADDSAYAAASPETGAYTPSQVVDMPKKHRSLFGRRHAGKHSGKRMEEQSASEWLNVDENFNPTEVGKARGGWESFQEDSAYEQQARASQQPAAPAPDAWEENEDAWKRQDRWNGGAFSRARAAATDQAARLTHRGSSETNGAGAEEPVRRPRTAEELPPEFSEVAKLANRMARDDGSQRVDLAREEQQIYEFRDADVNVEVWFVALGSECSGDAGMKTFLQTHADELRGSIVINLDSVGAGRLSYLEHEGKVRKTKISTRMKRYLRMAVQATGIDVAASSADWRDTPASVAARHGLQAVTIAGMDGAKPAYMGQGDDVLENIDEGNLERTVDYVMNVVKNI